MPQINPPICLCCGLQDNPSHICRQDYFLISKKNLKCIGSKLNPPENYAWHNKKTFYIPSRLWNEWKREMGESTQIFS